MDVYRLSEDDFHHYAYDDKGELIHLTKKNGEIVREDYKCVACGYVMRPIMGGERIWHFRHKITNPNCNKESYLHQLAKKIIKTRFDNCSTFNMTYYVRERCSQYNNCPKRSESCIREVPKTFNLKDDYDICEIEEKDSHFPFRADLKLSSKLHPKRKPVFIEIAYTHDCEPEKINSGIKIIELKVFNDTDIDRPFVEEPLMLDYTSGNPYQHCELPLVRFYNFKREYSSDSFIKNCGRAPYFKAKELLTNRFRQSDSFIIKYNGNMNCSQYNRCRLACEDCKNRNIIIKDDLKLVYDTCTEDKDGNLVLTKNGSNIPSTTLKFSFEGKAKYEENRRIIEFLSYDSVRSEIAEDLMNINMNDPRKPYSSLSQPIIRFYNFDRKSTECTINLKRFAVVKDGVKMKYGFIDDIDCHHIDQWPENVLYGLMTPKHIAADMNFKFYGMIMACVNDYKIYNCSVCDKCYPKQGGCVKYGKYMYDLLANNSINKDEECRKCDKFEININVLKKAIEKKKIPLIEWKK